jgi:hypothetical protein
VVVAERIAPDADEVRACYAELNSAKPPSTGVVAFMSPDALTVADAVVPTNDRQLHDAYPRVCDAMPTRGRLRSCGFTATADYVGSTLRVGWDGTGNYCKGREISTTFCTFRVPPGTRWTLQWRFDHWVAYRFDGERAFRTSAPVFARFDDYTYLVDLDARGRRVGSRNAFCD